MRGWLVVLSLAVVVLGLGIGRAAITDSDEAYYAEAGREMVERGDYLTPHYNFTPRFQKPVLFYWIVAASYHLVGVTPFAARIGSALSGVGLALLAWGLGRRWFGAATGLRAGVIVATSMGTAAMARASLPDLPLAFFITSSTAAALVPLLDRAPRPSRWWGLSAALAGLAVLTKGPVGLVVPAIVVAPMIVLVRRSQRPSWTVLALAAVVFLAVAVPWYAAMTAVHGAAYLEGFFVGDNLERFATTRFNEHRSLLFYAPIIVAGLLPWSPLGLIGWPAFRDACRRRTRPGVHTLALACWSLAPLLLFSLSVGKQPRYVLPMLLPLALALARALESIVLAGRAPRPAAVTLVRWGGALGGGFFVALGVSLLRANPLLQAAGSLAPSAAAGVALAAGFMVMATATTRHWRRLVPALATASAATVVAMQFAVLARPGADPVERMAAAIARHRQPGEATAPYQVFVRNLVFYTHLPQSDLYDRDRLLAFLDSPDRVLCVMPAAVAKTLRQEGRPVRRLAEIPVFDPSTARPRTLLDPDPARELRAVVLVANR